jgi:ADP-ribose pyrophosphatase YjhB (NUDIX family)
MHFIQKHILDTLRETPSMRYARIKPDEIESGHFRYHLTQLTKDGYVDQAARGLYTLTSKGQHYVDGLSSHKIAPERMPKVISYSLLFDDDTLLLQKKSKQPYMDLLNMVGGKVHEGENCADASIREVLEKTGVSVSEPELCGVFEILINNDDGLLSHVIAYVFAVNVSKAAFASAGVEPIKITELAECTDLAPDLLPIIRAIQRETSVCVTRLELKV